MLNLVEDIDNFISNCNNDININILGINYLEKLKYSLIDKLKNVNSDFYRNYEKQEIRKKYGENNLNIKIENHLNAKSTIKNHILNDQLSIVLFGSKNIEIYENFELKESNSLNLFKNMGIVIPKDTIINETISKESFLIDIINIKEDFDIEK